MATGLALSTSFPCSIVTPHAAQYWPNDADRQVHAQLLIGRPDGYTWFDASAYLVRAEVELGDVSGLGTGNTGADGVVRRMRFTLQSEGMLIPSWDENISRDENYVVGDELDVIGDGLDSAALLIDRLFGTVHRYARDSFSPRDEDSAFNQFNGNFAPLLKANREVALLAAVTQRGVAPTPVDWQVLFQGMIDRTTTDGSAVTAECRDLAKRLMYHYVWEAEEFGDDDNPVNAATVIQQILNRYIKTATPQLYVPKLPPFTCGRFRVQYQSVWDAIQKVAAQFGWFVGYRWVPSLGEFRLTLMEPPRLKTVGSADFILSHVKNIYDHTDEIGDQHIGNVAVVKFINKATGKPDQVIVKNLASIAEWEERAMEFSEGELSLIDTPEEAEALGLAAVTDCGDIIGNKHIVTPIMPTADVFTGAVVDDPRIGPPAFMGVVSVRHVIDFSEAKFETEWIGQSRVVGGRERWRKMMTRLGAEPPKAPEDVAGGNKVMPKPLGVEMRGIIGGVALDVSVPPVDANRWAETEIHLSMTDGFTPSDATRVDGGRKTHFELTRDPSGRLVAGTTYYARVRYVDMKGHPGPFSDQVSAVAGFTVGSDLRGDLNSDGSVTVDSIGIKKSKGNDNWQLVFQGALVGEADDGEVLEFPDFETEPKIVLMPVALQTFDPAEDAAGQRVVLKANNVRFDGGVWKADLLCRLTKIGALVTNSLNQQITVNQSYTTPESDPDLQLTSMIGILGVCRAVLDANFGFPGGCLVTWTYTIEVREAGGEWGSPETYEQQRWTNNPWVTPYSQVVTAPINHQIELPSVGNWELRITYTDIQISSTSWTLQSSRINLDGWVHSSDEVLQVGRAAYIGLEGGE